ncbi:hypothetical protein FRB94_010372 [Tulasnella sp. JGI-2019a]|nr:hypothetical protein FRB93_009154 [Tulasnella sp. JGI-2019a]KAG8993793.1 hypothetical protein FRB94_010372 [Tulasnella sp. JGI-2019a]KAG9024731.1 hypothetical protein FRB95_011140 [Tulasnella sp. JGI-2019a]
MSQDSGKALIAAAKAGDISAIQTLIDSGADVNQMIDGETPVMAAATAGHEEAVKLLMEKGANRDNTAPSETGRCTMCTCPMFVPMFVGDKCAMMRCGHPYSVHTK